MRTIELAILIGVSSVATCFAQAPDASPTPAARTHVERFRTPESRAQQIEAETTEKLKQNPTSATLLNDRAIARMRLQNFTGALDDLSRAVQIDAANAEYRANYGYVLWKLGRAQEAIAAEREAIKLDEKNYTANYQLGRFLLRTGDKKLLPEAVQRLRQALELDARLYEVRFELIAAYRELGDLPSAANQLALLQDAKPSEPRVIYVDALLAADRGDTRTAIERFRSALSKDPELIGAWQDLGLLQLKLGNWSEAAEALGEVGKRNSSSLEAAYFGAVALYNLKRNDEAEAYVRRALRINAGFVDAKVLLGVILAAKVGGFDEAVEILTQALDLQPDNFEANFYLGRLNYTAARYAVALKNLETAARVRPNDTEVKFYLGTVLESLNESDRALAQYQEIVRLDSGSFYGQVGLGALYVKQGKLDEAITALSGALKQRPDNFEANWTLGRAQFLKEQFAEAEPLLKRAVSLQPNRTDARYQWALTLRRLGRAAEAKREFDTVERLNKEFREGKTN